MSQEELEQMKQKNRYDIISAVSCFGSMIFLLGIAISIFYRSPNIDGIVVAMFFLVACIVCAFSGILSFIRALNMKKAIQTIETGTYSNADEIERSAKTLSKLEIVVPIITVIIILIFIGFCFFWIINQY